MGAGFIVKGSTVTKPENIIDIIVLVEASVFTKSLKVIGSCEPDSTKMPPYFPTSQSLI